MRKASCLVAASVLALSVAFLLRVAEPTGETAQAVPGGPFFETREQTLARETDAQKALRESVKQVGGYVVFAQSRDKKATGEIYRMDPDGGNIVQLTKMGGLAGEPRIDATGRQVAFSCKPAKDKTEPKAGIYVVDIDGKAEPRLVAENVGAAPSWSPDGKALVTSIYSKEPGKARTHIVEVATGQAKDITPPNTRNNFHPYWSKDGKVILLTWQATGNWTSAAVAVDPEKKELVGQWKNPVRLDGCNWELSPANDKAAWVRDHAGDTYSSIWIAPFDLEKQTQGKYLQMGIGHFTGDKTWNYFPTFSPDGKYVLIVRCPGFAEAKALGWTINKYEGEKMDMWVVPADGGVMARLTWGLDNVTHPDWAKAKE